MVATTRLTWTRPGGSREQTRDCDRRLAHPASRHSRKFRCSLAAKPIERTEALALRHFHIIASRADQHRRLATILASVPNTGSDGASITKQKGADQKTCCERPDSGSRCRPAPRDLSVILTLPLAVFRYATPHKCSKERQPGPGKGERAPPVYPGVYPSARTVLSTSKDYWLSDCDH